MFKREFKELKNVISENRDMKHFRIRIDDEFQNKIKIEDEISELKTFNNFEFMFLPK
jgi:hypothetical protein